MSVSEFGRLANLPLNAWKRVQEEKTRREKMRRWEPKKVERQAGALGLICAHPSSHGVRLSHNQGLETMSPRDKWVGSSKFGCGEAATPSGWISGPKCAPFSPSKGIAGQ